MNDAINKLLNDRATITEIFIIDKLQSYMDLSDPSNPKWIEPVRLRVREKEDWKREMRDIIISSEEEFFYIIGELDSDKAVKIKEFLYQS